MASASPYSVFSAEEWMKAPLSVNPVQSKTVKRQKTYFKGNFARKRKLANLRKKESRHHVQLAFA